MLKKWKILVFIFLLAVVFCWLPTKPQKEFRGKIKTELKKYENEFPKVRYIILIDYNKLFFRKRLWVIDIKIDEILINSHVSHALKSGIIWARKFSNEQESLISSKGTFKTLNSYESSFGKNEYKLGMRIQGLEKGINDNEFKRKIVFHSSYWPWSSGCFMTLPCVNKEIIQLTREGNILIVLSDN